MQQKLYSFKSLFDVKFIGSLKTNQHIKLDALCLIVFSD